MPDIDHIDVELPDDQSEIQHFDVDLPDQTITVIVQSPPPVTVKPTGEDVAIQAFVIETIGPAGAEGPPGPAGSSILGGVWKAKTSVTSGDPGEGNMAWNNTDQLLATKLFLNDITALGTDVDRIFLQLLTVGSKLTNQDRDNSDKYRIWQIAGITDRGTYWDLDVVLLDGGGGNIANNQEVYVSTGAGEAADKTYVHNQDLASDTWVIYHNLGKYPAIQIVDSAGTMVIGEISHIDTNTSMALFSVPFGGKAICN